MSPLKRLLLRMLDSGGASDQQVLTYDLAADRWYPADPTGGLDAEAVRDTIGAALVAGSNITITVNDAGDTITIAATGGSSFTAEDARDAIGAALVAGANVTITVNDAGDTITIAAATDPEVVRDTIGAALVAGTGITITVNDAGDTITIAAAVAKHTAAIKYDGTISTGVGATRLYNDTGATWTIYAVRATVETAPTGGQVIVDVNKNGTTIFTTQANRPTIAASGLTSGKVTNMDVTTVADGDYLTVDIDTTTAPAANLTVQIVMG
jgi:hypothetical protein